MKAAKLTKTGTIAIEEMEAPAVKPGEVLVEIKSCGVCATDVKKFAGKSKAPFLPFVLGHEPAGVIKEFGEGVTGDLKIGDGVAVAPVLTCGYCPGCKSGRTAAEGMGMCDHYDVVGFSINGAFCEYISVPFENIIRLPDDLSFRDAALIEPVAACANGVLRAACTPPGTAVILGAGFMGLVCMQIFKALGNKVIISDLLDERLDMALKLGADKAINPQKVDVKETVLDFTGGQGADSVLCAIGIKELSESAVEMVRRGGRIVMLASGGKDVNISFNLNELHYNQTVITGSVSYTNASYLWAMDLLRSGKIGTERLITSTGSLEEVGELLSMTRDHVGIKNVMLIK
jgi:threonine dehydrogenase-like Zn-dependent dehydrogenase